jgi:hypothetical protein
VRQAKLGASYRVTRLRAGSPNWAKPNQQPIPSVALVAETRSNKSNKTGEAYTGNTIGRRGDVPPQSNTAPLGIRSVGDDFNASEARTEEIDKVRFQGTPGSESVACSERSIRNLGDPDRSCSIRRCDGNYARDTDI